MARSNDFIIVQKYINCFNKATLWLNKNGYTVHPRGVHIKGRTENNGNIVIFTSETLHFDSWPDTKKSGDKLHILASVIETISPKTMSCVRSTLWVSYYRIIGKVARIVESMHYDAEIPPQFQHPVCHAQGSNKPLRQLQPESFQFSVDTTAMRDRCQNIRIPSAFINLPGFLVTLTADHLQKHEWVDFITECSAAFNDIPLLAPCELTEKICATGKLMALNWYEI